MDISLLQSQYDLVVIGGGITGAGIFRAAACRGLNVLLVEQNDFAWGTSSRSSKLVHGGLRYLAQGRFGLTLSSVRQRQRLLAQERGLISPMNFFMPVYKDKSPSKHSLHLGLAIYSLMALKKQHHLWRQKDVLKCWPQLNLQNLLAGFTFQDAQTDDAGLVMTVIGQGKAMGGIALNYTRAAEIHRDFRGHVNGIALEDVETGRSCTIETGMVINATGVWADRFQPFSHKGLHLRPLRGSHLVFPGECFPFDAAISYSHPRDGRPVFVLPWEGCALVGTTDMDHEENLAKEPHITHKEAEYLMEAVRFMFPSGILDSRMCIGSFAGVRPVLSRGHVRASQESRESLILEEKGMITVTGGKLTTFNLMAQKVMCAVERSISRRREAFFEIPVPFFGRGSCCETPPEICNRLNARYGHDAAVRIIESADVAQGNSYVPGTDTLWAEIAYAAQGEEVRHLADLLLRRVRIGLYLDGGGAEHLDRIQTICSRHLSWSQEQWEHEKQDYIAHRKLNYGSPF